MEEVNNELAKIRATQERILYWLDATQAKLDRICAYLDKIESPQYKAMTDAKEAVINAVMNLFIWKNFELGNNQ